jgi:hypothetical protein
MLGWTVLYHAPEEMGLGVLTFPEAKANRD